MPLFAADNFDIKCKLGNERRIVGGAVEGELTIDCSAATKIRGLMLSYRVFRTINRTDMDSKKLACVLTDQSNHVADLRSEQGYLIPSTRAHRARMEEEDDEACKKTYEVEVVLVGSKHGASMDIPAGSYTYPFRVPLPSSLSPSETLRVIGGSLVSDSGYRMVFGIRHEIAATVMIANGVKDYVRKWPLRTQNGVHPALHAAQQPDTKFQDSPTFICGACIPSCGLWFPGPLRSDRSTFCLQVINPIVALDTDRRVKCRLQCTRDITSRPVYVHLVRKVRFGVAPGHKTHKILCAVLLQLPPPDRSLQGLTHDFEFSMSLVDMGLMVREQPMQNGIPLGAPIERPTGPVTVCSVDYSVSYYLCVRQDHSQDDAQCCKQNGVIPRDEARVPVLVFHTVSEEVPIGPHRMHWLPSTSTVHAAPQWANEGSSGAVNSVAGDSGGDGSPSAGGTSASQPASNNRENPVTIVGSYAQRAAAAGPSTMRRDDDDHHGESASSSSPGAAPAGSGASAIVVASQFTGPAEGSVVMSGQEPYYTPRSPASGRME